MTTSELTIEEIDNQLQINRFLVAQANHLIAEREILKIQFSRFSSRSLKKSSGKSKSQWLDEMDNLIAEMKRLKTPLEDTISALEAQRITLQS